MPVQPRSAQAFYDAVAETTGIPISRPLVNGSRVGSFFPVLQQNFAQANTDTIVSVNLGRVPSGYIVIRYPVGGGQITDGTNAGSDWTTTSLVLQASIAGTYSMLIF